MPFNTAGSVISTDLDNMVRGLNRDNSDTVLTNTTNETAVKSFMIPANVIGPTGGFHLRVCGTEAGTNSTKTIKLKFGSTLIATITDLSGTTNAWYFDVWCFNTATNSQRWFVQRRTNDLLTSQFSYVTSAEDTTQNKLLSVTGRSEEHTSELQSQSNLVCRLLLEKKKKNRNNKDIVMI